MAQVVYNFRDRLFISKNFPPLASLARSLLPHSCNDGQTRARLLAFLPPYFLPPFLASRAEVILFPRGG